MDKISLVNLGTYKEIEYLKRTLGPVLVSALAEVCVKRPTDPIEFLGHWLLRWRYNEELKRRDMENALEVIRQRQTVKCEREQVAQCKLSLDPYGQGVIPGYPFMPPGYGGPINPDDLKTKEEPEEEEQVEFEMPGEDYTEYEMPGEGGFFPYDANQINNDNYEGQTQYDPNWDTTQEQQEDAQYQQQENPYEGQHYQQQNQEQQHETHDHHLNGHEHQHGVQDPESEVHQ